LGRHTVAHGRALCRLIRHKDLSSAGKVKEASMSTQNLISATLAEETKNEILQKLADVRAKLDFLIALDPDQARGLFKASNGFAPFIEKAHALALAHPGILPQVFDTAEFHKDYTLIQALTPIQNRVRELADSLHDTLVAANSDAMIQALEVYAAIKQHHDKVPGLAVANDELGVFFQRTRRKAVPPSAS
jgi:hypothetical protein